MQRRLAIGACAALWLVLMVALWPMPEVVDAPDVPDTPIWPTAVEQAALGLSAPRPAGVTAVAFPDRDQVDGDYPETPERIVPVYLPDADASAWLLIPEDGTDPATLAGKGLWYTPGPVTAYTRVRPEKAEGYDYFDLRDALLMAPQTVGVAGEFLFGHVAVLAEEAITLFCWEDIEQDPVPVRLTLTPDTMRYNEMMVGDSAEVVYDEQTQTVLWMWRTNG